MEHLQRVWHASRERLPFRTPGSVPHFWDLLMLQLLRPKFLELAMSLLDSSPRIPLGTFSILLVTVCKFILNCRRYHFHIDRHNYQIKHPRLTCSLGYSVVFARNCIDIPIFSLIAYTTNINTAVYKRTEGYWDSTLSRTRNDEL